MLAPVLLLALVATAPPPTPAPTPSRVLVLPPQPAGETTVPWLGEAVADALPRDLAQLGVPVVGRVDRLRAHEVLDIPVVHLTHATSIRLAEALGVSRIVTGTYEIKDADVTFSLRLLDVERGTLSPPQIGTAPKDSILGLLHGLAWDLALAGPWKPTGSREAFLAKARSVPYAVFEAYGLGLSGAKSTSRMDYLRRVIKLRPDYDEARLALARLAIETREYSSVEATLTPVAADSPLAREAKFLQGVADLGSGRAGDGAALFARLAADDASPGVLSNEALALLGAGKPGGSALLRQAVGKAPGWTDVAFNLGWTLLTEGDGEAAVFWLRGVTKQAPHDVYARVALSWALTKAGRAEEGADEWRGVALMGPTYESLATPDLTRHLGRVLAWEQPLAIERSDVQLAASHVGRADAMLKANDTDGALRELTRAAYLDPYSARAHELMARAYVGRGDKEKAVNELQMSLWCREDTAVRLSLAKVLADLGRLTQAQAQAQKVLKAEPGNAEAVALLRATPKPGPPASSQR